MSTEATREHVSKFLKDKQALNSAKCITCSGIGTLDDSDFGDISFRTFICDACKGTGYRPVTGTKVQSQLNVETAVEIGERLGTAIKDILGRECYFALTLASKEQSFEKIKDIKYQHVSNASRPLVVMIYLAVLELFRGGSGKPRNGFRK